MYSNIYQPYTYLKNLKILYAFDVRFHTKVRIEVQFVTFTDCSVQNTHRRALLSLIHRQQTIYYILTQTKLSNIYRSKLIGSYFTQI